MATETITITEPAPTTSASELTDQLQPLSLKADSAERKYVDTTFNYRLCPTKGGDEIIWGGTFADMRRKHEPAQVRVHDVRGHEEEYKLDEHGFQFIKHETPETNWDDYQQICQVYNPQCEELFRKLTGASRVQVLGHLVRKRAYDEATKLDLDEAPDMHLTGDLLPAHFVHVDQSYQGARRKLYTGMDYAEAAKREKSRYGIFNLWRPLTRPATNEPLALCDARSVREDELFDTMHLVPINWPKARPLENHMWMCAPPEQPEQHQWRYWSNMQLDEVLVFKMFDSSKKVARRVPHTAFPTPDDFGPPRHSIETRCMLFWDDEPNE